MRLQLIEPDETDGATKEIFKKLVMVPNVICQMANSPPLIDTYANYHTNLDNYKLSAKYRKMISLAVSQFNDCSYCIALHTTTAVEGSILTKEECMEARRMNSSDSKSDAVLSFTREALIKRGKINDETLALVKDQGFDDQEIVEMIAMVSFITLANFVANVGEPELDFLEPAPIN
jgi:uncharacterized peroxidase-related enzyme